jgi:hypothetical protein
MPDDALKHVGLMMLVSGLILAGVGIVFLFASKVPFLGHLPGDLHYRGKNVAFHFPLATCIAVSLLLTLVLNVLARLFRR